jgi:hypothetical protein
MRTKEPMKAKRVEDLREIAFFWRHECFNFFVVEEALSLIMTQKGIDPRSNNYHNLLCSLDKDAKRKFWYRYASWYRKEQIQREMDNMKLPERTKLLEDEITKFFYIPKSKEEMCLRK